MCVLRVIDKRTYFVYKYNLICSLGQLSVASIHILFVLLLSLELHVTITKNTVKPIKTVYVVHEFVFYLFI